ncbi:hypothetical protein FO131_11365 [Salmonella bongori]|nr:hypothetical protein [Salmonella bongori serovar 48:i:-]ECG9253142.1 hypothetical protein [Salmonella bongori]EDP8706376.1 hypothetical protein [Salmonella bongori]EDP8726972.1 hypothetical protein [Salmonella bongori]
MTRLTKTKRFFMGAFVGALFMTNARKTNNKQYISRGYDSESGTTFPFLCLPVNSHVYVIQKVSVKSFPDAFWFIPAYPENLGSD